MNVNDSRPDPDALLESMERGRSTRGKLRVFLGMAPGVGKTCAMLDAAHDLMAAGVDVVAGVIETHGRTATEEKAQGIPRIPLRLVQRGQARTMEFDLDAALARKPAVVLVDELAHSNAPGSRHRKRFQDVMELLGDGIDVFTTLNVQHLESIHDIVERITGVRVRERVPDHVLDAADNITLVDLPAEELIQRLRDGRIYRLAEVDRAAAHFFQHGNLIALRDLALRQVADRVDDEVRDWRKSHALPETWTTTPRLLVAISSSPLSDRVVRVASRLAGRLHADWSTVFIEMPSRPMKEDARHRLLAHTRLAESLGARTVRVDSDSIVEGLLEAIAREDANILVIGRPHEPRWWKRWSRSPVEELIEQAGDIEVHVVGDTLGGRQRLQSRERLPGKWHVMETGPALLTLVACAAFGLLLKPWVHEADLAMLFLLGIAWIGYRYSLVTSLLSTAMAVVAFNFLFVEPRFTLQVSDARFLLSFLVIGLVGSLISGLAARVKMHAALTSERERRTSALYALTQELAQEREPEATWASAARLLARLTGADAIVVPMSDHNTPDFEHALPKLPERPEDRMAAQWCAAHSSVAGAGTDTLPTATCTWFPLVGSEHVVGVAGFDFGASPTQSIEWLQAPAQRDLILSALGQVAVSVERATASRAIRDAHVGLETERARSALLSSVSHDLRTPLGTIMGGIETVLEPGLQIPEEKRRELLQSALTETRRLGETVRNLLQMTRLDDPAIRLRGEWVTLDDVLGPILQRMHDALAAHPLEIISDVELWWCDPFLMELALANMLENLVHHTEEGIPARIVLSRAADKSGMLLEYSDGGPGVAADEQSRIFQRFYRGQAAGSRGSGLGLSICSAVAQVHGGTMSYIPANRRSPRALQGACFRMELAQPSDVASLDMAAYDG